MSQRSYVIEPYVEGMISSASTYDELFECFLREQTTATARKAATRTSARYLRQLGGEKTLPPKKYHLGIRRFIISVDGSTGFMI